MRNETPNHSDNIKKSKVTMQVPPQTKSTKTARIVSPPPRSPTPSPRSSPEPKGRSIRRPSDKDGQRFDWSDAIALGLLGASILFSGDEKAHKGKGGGRDYRRGSGHYHGGYDRDYDYSRRSSAGSSYMSSPYGGSRRSSGGSRRSSTW